MLANSPVWIKWDWGWPSNRKKETVPISHQHPGSSSRRAVSVPGCHARWEEMDTVFYIDDAWCSNTVKTDTVFQMSDVSMWTIIFLLLFTFSSDSNSKNALRSFEYVYILEPDWYGFLGADADIKKSTFISQYFDFILTGRYWKLYVGYNTLSWLDYVNKILRLVSTNTSVSQFVVCAGRNRF